MESFKLLSLQDCQVWKEYYYRLPAQQQDVYYSPDYYSLYQNYGDGEARCFIYEEGSDFVLYPFLINPITSLGFTLEDEYYDIQGAYGYNGIVTTSKDSSFISRFHECFDSFCQGHNIIAEFSRFHPLLNNQEFASPEMKTIYSRKTVILDLTPPLDDIWANSFSSKNRNVIKKAQKDGVTMTESHDYEFFRQLYDQTMHNVNAEDFYFFPQSYYSEFEESFGNDLKLCFAMYDGKPISGSMFMFSKDYAHYHLSGRDIDYYKIAANNVVLWYGIQIAKERGCKWFHFGGGTTGDEDDRLLHFKQNFSKDNGEFWIGKRIHNPEIYDLVVSQWRNQYPDKYELNRIKLLGYREIK